MNAHPQSILYPDSRATAKSSCPIAALTLLLIAATGPAVLQAQTRAGQVPASAMPEHLWFRGVFRP
ncbi:MAG: hypothetical protein GY778_21805, partial [bacterium]|nr:hypothetical protein [bacterium]